MLTQDSVDQHLRFYKDLGSYNRPQNHIKRTQDPGPCEDAGTMILYIFRIQDAMGIQNPKEWTQNLIDRTRTEDPMRTRASFLFLDLLTFNMFLNLWI